MPDELCDYICEYRHHGAVWGIEVRASSIADAQRRLIAIGGNGRVLGVVRATIPLGQRDTWLAVAVGIAIGLVAAWVL